MNHCACIRQTFLGLITKPLSAEKRNTLLNELQLEILICSSFTGVTFTHSMHAIHFTTLVLSDRIEYWTFKYEYENLARVRVQIFKIVLEYVYKKTWVHECISKILKAHYILSNICSLKVGLKVFWSNLITNKFLFIPQKTRQLSYSELSVLTKFARYKVVFSVADLDDFIKNLTL